MIEKLKHIFHTYPDHYAFCIKGQFFTYRELQHMAANIQQKLKELVLRQNAIALIFVEDNIETYASILAVWFSGMCYVPVKAENPAKRNQSIIDQIKPDVIVYSGKRPGTIENVSFPVIQTNRERLHPDGLSLPELIPEDLAYVLFTSGSTGIPKGVKITFKNISTFLDNFASIGYGLNENDRFLQIYDLTFDASVHCFAFPLLYGACVYTVPPQQMKYLGAYKILNKYRITFAKMPPSTIAFLRPYFNQIHLPHLKFSLFGGEALPSVLVDKWRTCVPNAVVQNVYGPTEGTINCTFYSVPSAPKAYNGILSIGRPFGDTKAVIIDDDQKFCPTGEKGELCICGNQVTPGYWNGEGKNRSAFITLQRDGMNYRFYRTGDLAFQDQQGEIFYCGRIDNQVQVQGFRVELGEIEKHARDFAGASQVVAIAKTRNGKTRIWLFVENDDEDTAPLREYLAEELPSYMVPSGIIHVKPFPLTNSGKTDRKKLLEFLNNEE